MRRPLLWLAVCTTLGACSGDDDPGGTSQPKHDAGHDATDAAVEVAMEAEAEASGLPLVLLPKTGLTPNELAVLVNESDPQSVEIAEYYVNARGIPAANVVKLTFTPGSEVMSESDFLPLKTQVDAALSPSIQGLVITWTWPYRVACMSVTSAFSLGFDTKYCNTTGAGCGPTASIDFYDSESVAPFSDHAIRPAMMLAAKDAMNAKALIDRGVASDDTFPTGEGWLVRTTDVARSVRWPQFVTLTQDWDQSDVMKLAYVDNSNGAGLDYVENQSDVLFYFTGLTSVPAIETNTYRPGAVADHLTSFGGQALAGSGQMNVVAWLEAGVTASYGTTVEPCNYTTKFPNPGVLLPHYYRGGTVLEAYWKSVAAPGEGLFVGEPLARPYKTSTIAMDGESLSITTTLLDPAQTYVLESADSEAGPFSPVESGIGIGYHQPKVILAPPPLAPVYRLSVE